MNDVYHDKPLIFTETVFLSLSKLFLTLYLTWWMLFIMTSLWYLPRLYIWVYQSCFWHCIRHDKCRLLWQALDIYRGYMFEFIEAVSDTVLDMINAVYYDKPLIFTEAIWLNLSKLFLTMYLTWWMLFIMTSLWYSPSLYVWVYQSCFWHCITHDKCRLPWQAFDIYWGYISGEARLPSSGSAWSWFLPTYVECRIIIVALTK